MRASIAMASLAMWLILPGCAREHLSRGFGRAQRAAFQSQAVRPAERARPPSMALDTQEADVVSRAYIQSLAGRSRAEPDSILMVEPQGQRAQAIRLAPSVPKE